QDSNWPRLEVSLNRLASAFDVGYRFPPFRHDAVSGALLTQDEHRILSWSNDKTLRLCYATTGQQIGPAMKHDGAVRGALLTKDEQKSPPRNAAGDALL